jgi:hypothetical protein
VEHISIDNNFLNRTPMTQQLRERTDKLYYMKLKSLCTAKKMVTRLKKRPIEWEEICGSYTSDMGLTPRIYRETQKN